MEEIVRILTIAQVTHDVRAYRVTKPAGYSFEPGQATDVSINKEGWKNEKRPFTFTGLAEWPHLEFTIKSYGDHHGVTDELGRLREGDELIIGDAWGAIAYHGAGTFIAGGAGITPFLAIFRRLYKDNKIKGNQLFFSNKTAADIILHDELTQMLGADAHFILTQEGGKREKAGGTGNLHIDRDFLRATISDFSQPFYICGPDKMVSDLASALTALGAKPESVVFEK
ncbi:MAG: flavodoxin reductase [Bacteroidota bacterium]|nr:flavodoxin reductase [Bacteroidota bacterium]MDP4214762.1 flavodoxin reductase [Bacteroidota bacterium]MDP4245670.1 flavodoxin reductase [Bacteroidota bacterium]MDP4253424.1 flavodoxin reductase [Bacteroidota bacterium]MDP4256859.1 flavodoxin reductase [Bacteroidota bacterium]